MLKIVRSNCNSIPHDIAANSPAWLQDIQQKLRDPLNATNRVYRIVPTSRRRKFLIRHLAQSAKIIPQLKVLPKLTKLRIETVDISAADVEAIKAALPNCTVDFKPISDADKEATLVKKLRL